MVPVVEKLNDGAVEVLVEPNGDEVVLLVVVPPNVGAVVLLGEPNGVVVVGPAVILPNAGGLDLLALPNPPPVVLLLPVVEEKLNDGVVDVFEDPNGDEVDATALLLLTPDSEVVKF